jgi:hypothetical protein
MQLIAMTLCHIPVTFSISKVRERRKKGERRWKKEERRKKMEEI